MGPERADLGSERFDLGPEKGLGGGRTDVWKFTPVSYRTLVLRGRHPKSIAKKYFLKALIDLYGKVRGGRWRPYYVVKLCKNPFISG